MNPIARGDRRRGKARYGREVSGVSESRSRAHDQDYEDSGARGDDGNAQEININVCMYLGRLDACVHIYSV